MIEIGQYCLDYELITEKYHYSQSKNKTKQEITHSNCPNDSDLFWAIFQ